MGKPLDIKRVLADSLVEEALQHHKWFEILREAQKARGFQLALNVDVWSPVGEYAVRKLEKAVAEEREKEGLNRLPPNLLVSYRPRRSRL